MALSTRLRWCEVLDELFSAMLERLEVMDEARERGLKLTREVVRLSSRAIRAAHTSHLDEAERMLARARKILDDIESTLSPHPMVYYAGFVHHAQQEYAEGCIFISLIKGERIPTPEELGVMDAAYLSGVADAVGELRRHILGLLAAGRIEHARTMLSVCEEIHHWLVQVDYPDAITMGLRRKTDVVAQLIDRTWSDVGAFMAARRIEEATKR